MILKLSNLLINKTLTSNLDLKSLINCNHTRFEVIKIEERF